MSYDITIAADESFSKSVPIDSLRAYLSTLANLRPNGDRGFLFQEDERLWMEIDLEAVTEEGDLRDDSDELSTVNCVRLHIPYPRIGTQPETDYFPIAVAIGRHLGWPVLDEQSGEPLKLVRQESTSTSAAKPWWKFW